MKRWKSKKEKGKNEERMKEGRRVPTTTTSDLCSPVSKQKQRQCQCQCQQWKANTDANIQRETESSFLNGMMKERNLTFTAQC